MDEFHKIIAEFNSIDKNKKRILIWYIISLSIILLEYFINSKLDMSMYFHPLISIFIYILLLIDLFFIPIIILTKEILEEQKNFIIKVFQIFISGVGIGILSIIVIVAFSFFNKKVFSMDTVAIDYRRDRVYVENVVWLESSHHVDIYQVENIIFAKWIDSYYTG